MQTTHHFQQRMSHRGINIDMAAYVVEHGVTERDKFVLGRKEASDRLAAIRREERLLKKILDKGGVVVVAEGDALITTYNCTQRRD